MQTFMNEEMSRPNRPMQDKEQLKKCCENCYAGPVNGLVTMGSNPPVRTVLSEAFCTKTTCPCHTLEQEKCKNCQILKPGGIIKVDDVSNPKCSDCGRDIGKQSNPPQEDFDADFDKVFVENVYQGKKHSFSKAFLRHWIDSKRREWLEQQRAEMVEEIQGIFNKCKTERGLSRALANFISLNKYRE